MHKRLAQAKELCKTSRPDGGQRKAVDKWLTIFSEQFNREITPQNTEIYQRGLADLSVEQIEAACEICLQTCKFMPVIADIRGKIKQAQLGDMEAAARDEWDSIVGSLDLMDWHAGRPRACGEMAMRWSDAAERAVRACGGFEALYYTRPEHLGLVSKRFFEEYRDNVEREQDPRYLSDAKAKQLWDALRGLLPEGHRKQIAAAKKP